MFVFGFQFYISLFDGCIFAFAEKVGYAGFNAVRILTVNFPCMFFLVGYFAVKFRAAPLLHFILSLEFFRHSCISPWQYNHVIRRS